MVARVADGEGVVCEGGVGGMNWWWIGIAGCAFVWTNWIMWFVVNNTPVNIWTINIFIMPLWGLLFVVMVVN